MIDAIVQGSNLILGSLKDWTEFLGANPRSILGIVLGLLVSWGGSQLLKRAYNLTGGRVTAIAFLLGVIVCFTISTAKTSISPFPWTELWISISVGMFSPAAYKIMRRLLMDRYPWIYNLSNDPEVEPKPRKSE